jgi:uncharacterized protein (UPF0276 family)
MRRTRPAVGLLYNPATPLVIEHAPELVEYLAVMPDRLWHDFGPQAPGPRFHRVSDVIELLKACAEGRIVSGHGLGLSLPSAMPLDEGLLAAVAAMTAELGFSWYSEHLSVFITPQGNVPNAQAGLGLPVVYDDETFAIVRDKVRRMQAALGCPILLENGTFFTPVPEMELTEPEFLNRLYAQERCCTLLDLHNLFVTWRNGGPSPAEHVEALDPDAVMEIHLGGGEEVAGFYLDSHSTLTPAEVWDYAFDYAPRFRNLRAITFEFHESYYDRFGAEGLADELRRMHELADLCGAELEAAGAG